MFFFLLPGGIYITFQSVVFGAFHCRVPEEPAIVVFAELVPLFSCHAEKLVAGLQLGRGIRLCEAVPGTCLLASVATVDGVAHSAGGKWRERFAVFDGLVAETARGIEGFMFGISCGG